MIIKRPFTDNPNAYISQVKLEPRPKVDIHSNRYAAPKTAAASVENSVGPSNAPVQNNAFAPPTPPGGPGAVIDTYA